MKVHFYIEANPLRANLCKLENLHLYEFSSYRLYAYGIRDVFTDHLAEPEWYQKLGSTPAERQLRYLTTEY